jgi:hypothetical protein
MDGFLEYIGHSTNPAGISNINSIRDGVRSLMRPYFAGLYVNYPEFGYSQNDYSYLYWGQNLQRLAILRSRLDPTQLFGGAQQLPLGPRACPGALSVSAPAGSGARVTRDVQITGYQMGQLVGMRASWTMSPGCSVASVNGATLTASGNVYTAEAHSHRPFRVTIQRKGTMSASSCRLTTSAINGISC